MLAWQRRHSAKACGLFLMIILLIAVPLPPAVAFPASWQGSGILAPRSPRMGRDGRPLAPSGIPVPWEGLMLAGPWAWTGNGPLHLCFIFSGALMLSVTHTISKDLTSSKACCENVAHLRLPPRRDM